MYLGLSPGFVGSVRPTSGGGWSWTASWVLRLGVDARGFVEDLPASFRRVLFEELVARDEMERL